MDKDVFKAVMRDRGIPVTRNITLRQGEGPENPFDYPAFVKPARLGSSVGIVRVTAADELAAALEAAFAHDPRVIVEAAARGLEIECAVLGDDSPIASTPGEIVLVGAAAADGGWYDYEAKYTPGGMELIVPARIPDEVAARVRTLAAEAFTGLGCAGLARADFFVDMETEAVLVNELNTMPGFTETSVYGKLFAASGVPYEELLARLVELAVERHARERAYQF
jgi:D-alanine-D-alanine ligase